MGGAGLDGGEGVGDGAAGVVLGMDAEPGTGLLQDVGDGVLDLPGQGAAVGVAEHHHVGAGLVRGADHGKRVVTVSPEAVEEVLAVDENAAALFTQVSHAVAEHLQVLVEGGAQGQLHVAVVGLGDEGDHGGAGIDQCGQLEILCSADAGAAGGAEGDQLRVLQVELVAGACEELGVPGVGPGPAAFDEADAEVVQVPGDGEFVRDGQIDALALRAVAQGGVEDVEGLVNHVRVFLSAGPVCQGDLIESLVAQTKRPLAERERSACGR